MLKKLSEMKSEWGNLAKDDSEVEIKCKTALKYPDKNRYPDVLPFDGCRVTLAPKEDNEDGYINASYINLPEETAISTQGPLPQSFADFWQMVWVCDNSILKNHFSQLSNEFFSGK